MSEFSVIDGGSIVRLYQERGYSTELDFVVRATDKSRAPLGCVVLKIENDQRQEYLEIGWLAGDRVRLTFRLM